MWLNVCLAFGSVGSKILMLFSLQIRSYNDGQLTFLNSSWEI